MTTESTHVDTQTCAYAPSAARVVVQSYSVLARRPRSHAHKPKNRATPESATMKNVKMEMSSWTNSDTVWMTSPSNCSMSGMPTV